MHLTTPRSPFARSFQPLLLALERREVPSATAAITGGKLAIHADNAGDYITIRDDGKGDVTASLKSATGTTTIKGSHISQISVLGGDGTDTVNFGLTGNMLTALELDMDLGAGNDHAYMDFYAGISNTALNVDVHGGAGNDSVESIYGLMNNAKVAYHAALGDGADSSSVTLFQGLSGKSTASFDVAGETGADRLDFNVMGKIAAPSTLNLHAENSQDANDRVTMRYRGELDGR